MSLLPQTIIEPTTVCFLAAMKTKSLKIQQLSTEEQSVIGSILRKHDTASNAFRFINSRRANRHIRPIGKDAIHRFAKGSTHKCGAPEARGQKRALSEHDVRKLDKTRRRLIKSADNEWRVTYKDVIEAAIEMMNSRFRPF